MDCKDGHPKFTARKSLEFVCEQLKKQDGLDWVQVCSDACEHACACPMRIYSACHMHACAFAHAICTHAHVLCPHAHVLRGALLFSLVCGMPCFSSLFRHMLDWVQVLVCGMLCFT